MNSINTISVFIPGADHLFLAALSSAYVFGDACMLIPAGIILDRVNPLKVILIALFLYLLSFLIFINSSSHSVMIGARFMMGTFHAFALLSCFKIIANILPENEKTFSVSMTLTIALLGGLIAQEPLFIVLKHTNVHTGLSIDLILGAMILVFLWTMRRNNCFLNSIHATEKAISLGAGIKYALTRKDNWFASYYVCVMSLPLMIFGSVWGIDFLTSINKLTEQHASYVSGMLFIGVIIGSPIVGIASYKIKMKSLLYFGLLGTIASIFIVIFSQKFNFDLYSFIFLALGLVSSSQILGYSIMSKDVNSYFAGLSIGISNSLVMFFTALVQMIFGILLNVKLMQEISFVQEYFLGFVFLGVLFISVLIFSFLYTLKRAN